jgi:hypothetical protein
MDSMPAPLAALVTDFIARAGLRVYDAAAMRSECESVSRRLAAVLDGYYDADTGVECYATPTPAPVAELAGDELADGHVVCRVEYSDDASSSSVWHIDLTAAQFSSLGWTGPRTERVG